MSSPIEDALWSSLSTVKDPEILRPITDLGMIDSATVDANGQAHIGIALTIAGCPAARRIEADVLAAAETTPGVGHATVDVRVMTAEERQAFIERVRGDRAKRVQQFGSDSLTRVIAVTSGKGGVGKSSLTANLAASFAAQGLSVGILDADVFGFSIPAIMGLSVDGRVEQPTRVGDMILPPLAHGVRVISIGMFLGEADPRQTAVSWRGPMLHRTLEQFLTDVWWGDLDILLLDLPPGTGDIAISLGQLLPQAEVIVVTTPQPAAADVAVRSALVARQTGQRVIGVIENMSGLAQADGTILELFGSGGGEVVAQLLNEPDPSVAKPRTSTGTATRPLPSRATQLQSSGSHTLQPQAAQRDEPKESNNTVQAVSVLGHVPLSPKFRELSDAGVPAVLAAPEDSASRSIEEIALKLLAQGRGLSGRHLGVSLS